MIAWPVLQGSLPGTAMSDSQMQMTYALLAVPLALLDAVALVLLAVAIVRSAR